MSDYTRPVPPRGPNTGRPDPRIESRAKVTGGIVYASDTAVPNPVYAYLLTSTIAKGAILRFDFAESKALAGVIEIFTHENLPRFVPVKLLLEGGQASQRHMPLQSPAIVHEGQIVGVVVAETYEIARDAANRARVEYTEQQPSAGFDSAGAQTVAVASIAKGYKDNSIGDFEHAYANAANRIESRYSTPTQHHNPLELYTTTAEWRGSDLILYEPSQLVWPHKFGVALQLGIDPDRVTVINPFVGGAFGGKGMSPRSTIIAAVARIVRRPVKLVATRDQGFTVATYRAETRHTVKLSADHSGRLTALSHDGFELTSRMDDYKVAGTATTTQMYAVPNVASTVSIVHADRNAPGFMRAPAEVPYMFALECAVDELAEKCGIDPVEFRRINDTQTSLITGKRYTSRSLNECYAAAAKAFGWSKRDPKPRSTREGDWQVGYGCATACYPTVAFPATARVRVTADGHARVQIATHDMGTGATTIMGQIAAEAFHIPLEHVTVEMGDTRLPPGPLSGGSATTASGGSAVMAACKKVIAKFGGTMPVGAALGAAFTRLKLGSVEEYAEWSPPGAPPAAALYTGSIGGPGNTFAYAFGAQFVEVRVHSRTREIRVPRITGAFAAGRIMNPRTARSQLMGGMIWGISSALHESTEIDEKRARYANDNFSEYLIPVNADIRTVEVIMVPEVDDLIPMGAKGIGELGNVGTNAAVANAVYHATGKRIRDLPITIDKLIA